jgi:hypothetical protein
MPADLASTQRILELLERFSFSALKDLFWTELSYPRASDPLSRRGWPEELRGMLADDPLLLSRVGEEGGFHVLYCRMAGARLSLVDERLVITRLLREHPWALFVFSNAPQSEWHLVNVRVLAAPEGEDGAETAPRRVFRRIAVTPGELNRTGAERLTEIDAARFPAGERTSPLAVQEIHDHAFDVEKVSRDFYRRYREVFERVEEQVEGFDGDPDARRLFTQRLFHRLMFVAFVQKKGWFRLGGAVQPDHLHAMWEAYGRREGEERHEADNFYRDRLLLFYREVLSRERYEAAPDPWVTGLVGSGPYLNGGLFEEDALDRRPGVVVPDSAIYEIVINLFGRFNFTITEASPLEVEVAVDPEMLGKVFEELVTGRHEKGKYYTPKPIVSFMCREALKGYLRTAVPQESEAAVARFVDAHDAAALGDGEAVLRALREITVCDPACGSGAYLLGMLHELLDLRAALFNTRGLDTASAYDRKLEIIENNIFGADLDAFAVETARLRLWLSLVVDFERGDSGAAFPQLPNLEYKIGEGDSLAHPLARQYDLMDAVVDAISTREHEHLRAGRSRKRELEAELRPLREQLAIWIAGGAVQKFDMRVDFADVFARGGGFDVVLANPPYVRQELIREQKPRLKANFPQVYTGGADLYVYFYARALEMLAAGGMLVFISSNKWFRAAYGARLRQHVGEQARVVSITDFGDLPVFESATAYPMIFIAQKQAGGERGGFLFAQPASLDPPYPDIAAVVARSGRRLPPQAAQGSEWRLVDPASAERTARMSRAGSALSEYVDGRIYYGIKTGLNGAFLIDGATRDRLVAADAASAEVIRPLVTGREIQRWAAPHGDRWLIVTPVGVDIARYPAVLDHLSRWRPAIERRHDQGRHWWELRPCDYYAAFDAPKIVFPDIAKGARFAVDTTGVYVLNTAYIIPVDDPYLLAVLNSAPVERFYADVSSQVRGGYLRFIRQYVERIPIPRANPREREAIAELAHQCVRVAGSGPGVAEWEAEIDARVASLYGLDAREQAA